MSTIQITTAAGETVRFETSREIHDRQAKAINALAATIGVDPESSWEVSDALEQIVSVMDQKPGLRDQMGSFAEQTEWAQANLDIAAVEL